MIDKTRPAGAIAVLPEFTPVPRQCKRHDGWTPDRQRRFIEALADTGSVRHAAMAVNMAQEGAYALRRHPQAQSFREAWEAAHELGVQRLRDVALDRALNGVEVPVYSYGKLIGTRRKFNDRLLMHLLRNNRVTRITPETLDQLDASTRAGLERLKRHWHEEWEKERNVDSDKVLEAIDRKIDKMRERREAAMSPRTRRLRDAYQKSMSIDDSRPYACPEDEEEETEGQALEHRSALPGPSVRLL